jgi:hypothetical protein
VLFLLPSCLHLRGLRGYKEGGTEGRKVGRKKEKGKEGREWEKGEGFSTGTRMMVGYRGGSRSTFYA